MFVAVLKIIYLHIVLLESDWGFPSPSGSSKLRLLILFPSLGIPSSTVIISSLLWFFIDWMYIWYRYISCCQSRDSLSTSLKRLCTVGYCIKWPIVACSIVDRSCLSWTMSFLFLLVVPYSLSSIGCNCERWDRSLLPMSNSAGDTPDVECGVILYWNRKFVSLVSMDSPFTLDFLIAILKVCTALSTKPFEAGW